VINNELITKYLQKGNFEKAIKEYTSYLDAIALKDKDQNYANILNALGDVLVKANKIDEAYVKFCETAEIYIKNCYYSNASAVLKKCLRFKPSAIDIRYRLGEVACLTQSFHEAEQYFTDYAQFYFSQNNVAEALRALEKITQINPDKVEYKIRLAEAYRLTNSIDKMFTAYQSAVAYYKQTNDERLQELVGTIIAIAVKSNYLKNQVFLNIVTDYIALLYDTGAIILAGNTVIDLCSRLESNSEFELSESLLHAALQKDKKSIPLHVKLLDNYDKRGLIDKSIPYYISLGQLLIVVNEGQAEKIFRKVLSLDPNNYDIKKYFSSSMEFIPNPTLKEKNNDVILTLDSTTTEPIIVESSRIPETKPITKEQVSVSDIFEQYISNLSHSVLNTLPEDISPEIQTIFQDFKSGVASQLGEDPESHYAMGICYKEMAFFYEAINEFKIALSSKEYQLQALNMIASCYSDHGDYDSAVEIFHDVLALPELPEYATEATNFSLSSVYFLQKKIFDSFEVFKKILEPASFARDPNYKPMIDAYLKNSLISQEYYQDILIRKESVINYDEFIDATFDDAVGVISNPLDVAPAFISDETKSESSLLIEFDSADVETSSNDAFDLTDAVIEPTAITDAVFSDSSFDVVTDDKDLLSIEIDFDEGEVNELLEAASPMLVEKTTSSDAVAMAPTPSASNFSTTESEVSTNTEPTIASDTTTPPILSDREESFTKQDMLQLLHLHEQSYGRDDLVSIKTELENSQKSIAIIEESLDRYSSMAENVDVLVDHATSSNNQIKLLKQQLETIAAKIQLLETKSPFELIHALENKISQLQMDVVTSEEILSKVLNSVEIKGAFKEITDTINVVSGLHNAMDVLKRRSDISGVVSDIQNIQVDLQQVSELRTSFSELAIKNLAIEETNQKLRKDILAIVTDYKKFKQFIQEEISKMSERQQQMAELVSLSSVIKEKQDLLISQYTSLSKSHAVVAQKLDDSEKLLASQKEQNLHINDEHSHLKKMYLELEKQVVMMSNKIKELETSERTPPAMVQFDLPPLKSNHTPDHLSQQMPELNVVLTSPIEKLSRNVATKRSRISFI